MHRVSLAGVLVVAACGGGDDTPINTDLRTLDTCATDIAADAPAFYRTFFACVDVAMEDGDVVITTTALPPHVSAYYPAEDPNYVAFDTMGNERFKNPNQIASQDLAFHIPSDPTRKAITIDDALVDRMAGTGEEYGGDQGVALDGVVMFAGFAAPGDDIDQERFTFDAYEAHPQNTGIYHYHGASPGPLEVLAAAGVAADVELYGIMCDGTPVLGCTELDGATPAGALDAQGGHSHDLTDGTTTYFTDRYHTHVCPGVYADYAPEIQAHEEGDDCVNDGPPP